MIRIGFLVWDSICWANIRNKQSLQQHLNSTGKIFVSALFLSKSFNIIRNKFHVPPIKLDWRCHLSITLMLLTDLNCKLTEKMTSFFLDRFISELFKGNTSFACWSAVEKESVIELISSKVIQLNVWHIVSKVTNSANSNTFALNRLCKMWRLLIRPVKC